jgi:hypothetical protein
MAEQPDDIDYDTYDADNESANNDNVPDNVDVSDNVGDNNDTVDNVNDDVVNDTLNSVVKDTVDEYDDDDEDAWMDEPEEEKQVQGIDEVLLKMALKQLLELNADNLAARKQEESKFLPSTKRFLKLSMAQKTKQISPSITINLLYLCRNIVTGKIPMDINPTERRVMRRILNKTTPLPDVKLMLVEDFRLHAILDEALSNVENSEHTLKRQNGR